MEKFTNILRRILFIILLIIFILGAISIIIPCIYWVLTGNNYFTFIDKTLDKIYKVDLDL